jgi:hypothetical protein
MTNNFDIILPLLKFTSEDDFYYLQILQRKKENKNIGSNTRVIKNYYIGSIDYLLKHKDEIINLCKFFNARASIRLNKRSYKKAAFKSLEKITNQILNEDYISVKSFYSRVVGQYSNDKNKTWIIDIDGTKVVDENLIKFINSCMPEGNKIVEKIPSKSGVHLITKPFDLREFGSKYPDFEVHKDNPTNLFIP